MLCSWMRKFGVAKATCRLAASAIGPSGQCGARLTSYASAMAAIRRTSEMPPACERSGWATAMPAGQDVAEVPAGVQPLAGRERHCRGSTRPAQIAGVLGQRGSSTNSGCSGSSSGSSRRDIGGGHAAVEVDGDVPLGAEGVADRGDPLDDRRGAGRGLDRVECGRQAFILTAVKPASTCSRRLVGDLAAGSSPPIQAYTRTRSRTGPPSSPCTGRAVGLARDVPQGLVDAGDGAGEHRAAAVKAAPGQHLPVVLDAQRVLADQLVGQLGHGGTHGLRAALDYGLAPSGDPLVGLDAQEQPPWRHQEGARCQ